MHPRISLSCMLELEHCMSKFFEVKESEWLPSENCYGDDESEEGDYGVLTGSW